MFALLFAVSGQSATLGVSDRSYAYREWVNGQLIKNLSSPEPDGPSQPARDDPPAISADAMVGIDDCLAPAPPQPPGCRTRSEVVSTSDYVVEADDGESPGDAAPICAQWDGSVAANTTADGVAAAASGGGTPSASASNAPIAASASTTDPAFVQINAGAMLPMGELSIETPPDASNTESFRLDLPTSVGDIVTTSVAVAVAAAVPVGGDAAAAASGLITLSFGPCSEPPAIPPAWAIPTLSQWAIVLLGMLLAAVGYLGVRRQSRD
ncbi:MAG: IPTL-CTERM sorting domain-containing protein [Thiohalocapsa sp.]